MYNYELETQSKVTLNLFLISSNFKFDKKNLHIALNTTNEITILQKCFKILLLSSSALGTFFASFVAHQKEGVDGTKKSTASSQKNG